MPPAARCFQCTCRGSGTDKQQHRTHSLHCCPVGLNSACAQITFLQAFDAAGRQRGAFIAQAVVNVAAMLQDGSLSATAALVNRKGEHTQGITAPTAPWTLCCSWLHSSVCHQDTQQS